LRGICDAQRAKWRNTSWEKIHRWMRVRELRGKMYERSENCNQEQQNEHHNEQKLQRHENGEKSVRF